MQESDMLNLFMSSASSLLQPGKECCLISTCNPENFCTDLNPSEDRRQRAGNLRDRDRRKMQMILFQNFPEYILPDLFHLFDQE